MNETNGADAPQSVPGKGAEKSTEKGVVLADPRPVTQEDGSVDGYSPGKTLPLRVELGRQLGRLRTKLALGFLAILPLLLLLAFQLGGNQRGGSRNLVDIATSSGVNFAVFTLFASTNFLLVVIVALFFGDTVASEASWSSLKYLLSAPIPRLRLLRQKAIVAAMVAVGGLVLLAVVALVVGSLRYGVGDFLSPTGEALMFPVGVLRFACATAYLALQLTWVAGLALLLSVCTDAPLGAVGGAVVLAIVSEILDQITALADLRDYLPTHYATAWVNLLSSDIDWASLAHGVFAGLAYAAVFVVLAARHFHRKDVLS
jgi:ABC-2 type transport system permease protein